MDNENQAAEQPGENQAAPPAETPAGKAEQKIEGLTKAEAAQLVQDELAAAEKKRIDPARLAAQIKTFKEFPELWDEVRAGMGETGENDRVRELELKLTRKDLITEFGLKPGDEIMLTGSEDEMRERAEYLASDRKRNKAGQQPADEHAGAGDDDLAQLPQRMRNTRSKRMTVDDAVDNLHRSVK